MTYYVSVRGNPAGDGTKEAPFASIEEAQTEARKHPGSTVVVTDGVYRTALSFDVRDNGTTYLAPDGAVLTGGLTVPYAETKPVTDGVRERLQQEAADHIRVIDLTAYGLTAADWGEPYPIGAYHTAARYDDGRTGVNLEVFSGTRRMIPARYPNEGYLKIEAVLDNGEVNEFPPQNYWVQNYGIRNPRGGAYIIDSATNERLKSWQEPETAWAFGYFYWDWADSSTPVRIDTANRAIFPKYVSSFGCRPGALYYFYHVLEELDAPGEWYLDRRSGMLYVYPYAEGDDVTVSLGTEPLIKAADVKNLTIDGFTLTAARANGVELTGSNNTLRRLTVTGIAGHGITVSGTGNTVADCEISHTGRGGVHVWGGDRKTLTPGGNTVINCYIHDFSEVYQTYQAGIALAGVGNRCAHNEICGSPHVAITYGGNEHLIEYNYIHDVVTHSGDAGAIYAGYDWCAHGTVIRYNLLRNIGSDSFAPDGIYWDDGLSGQTAYGNILIDVRKYAFLIGGGFDNVVRDNVILGESVSPIFYDDRDRDGFVHGGWARQSCDTPDSPHWKKLRSVPYSEEPWKSRYPTLAALSTDFSHPDDPNFPVNPSRSVIDNNVIINRDKRLGWLAESVYRYSTVGVNPTYATPEEADFDLQTLTFRSPRMGFSEIPVEQIGRLPVLDSGDAL